MPIANLSYLYPTTVGGVDTLENKYQYNGKELEDALGLNWNDYGARYYLPDIQRWGQIDPLAEKYTAWSGYNYVVGNPIGNIDPDGKTAEAAIVGNKIIVRATINFYGSGASPNLAQQQAAQIQKDWNAAGGKVAIDGKTYKVVFEITGNYDVHDTYGPSNLPYEIKTNTDYTQNYIRVENETDIPDNTSYIDKTGGNTGFWKSNQLSENSGNSGTHEFGHQLGLKHLEQMSSSTNPPSIMLTEAYNKWVDAKYTKNLKDGTIVFDVSKRKVTQKDIDNIGLSKLN